MRLNRSDRISLLLVLPTTAALAAAGCATPPPTKAPSRAQEPAPAVSEGPPPGESGTLDERGKRYLTNAYLFTCAPEYVPYPEGQGPPVPVRSDAKWREREQELQTCMQEVAQKYAKLETVRAMTFNGKTQTMSESEMRDVVAQGPAFLARYTADLLRGERRRERFSDAVADSTDASDAGASP